MSRPVLLRPAPELGKHGPADGVHTSCRRRRPGLQGHAGRANPADQGQHGGYTSRITVSMASGPFTDTPVTSNQKVYSFTTPWISRGMRMPNRLPTMASALLLKSAPSVSGVPDGLTSTNS